MTASVDYCDRDRSAMFLYLAVAAENIMSASTLDRIITHATVGRTINRYQVLYTIQIVGERGQITD